MREVSKQEQQLDALALNYRNLKYGEGDGTVWSSVARDTKPWPEAEAKPDGGEDDEDKDKVKRIKTNRGH